LLRLIGVGNRWRGDDGAGLAVAALLRARALPGLDVVEHDGEPLDVIAACEGTQTAWLVDAVHSGAPAGTLHRFDASEHELPAALFRLSTHRIGLAEAVELARVLDRLPPRVIVHGIEGARFEAGVTLSPAVAAAVRRLAETLAEEVAACTAAQ
jgi:hydrogenase maturation protease